MWNRFFIAINNSFLLKHIKMKSISKGSYNVIVHLIHTDIVKCFSHYWIDFEQCADIFGWFNGSNIWAMIFWAVGRILIAGLSTSWNFLEPNNHHGCSSLDWLPASCGQLKVKIVTSISFMEREKSLQSSLLQNSWNSATTIT